MIRSPTCDFSYAGLKTAVLRAVQHHAPGAATDANRQVSSLYSQSGLLWLYAYTAKGYGLSLHHCNGTADGNSVLWYRLQMRADIAASFQRAAITQLEQRCRRGIAWARVTCPDITCVVLADAAACLSGATGWMIAAATEMHRPQHALRHSTNHPRHAVAACLPAE